MKPLLFCFLLLLVPHWGAAAEISAYEALRTIGLVKGEALLDSLLEARGAEGAPQPGKWLFNFQDETARGGIREIVVTDAGISSERTPLNAGPLASPGVMPAASLNLDSTGAFKVANTEAANQRVGFHSLNYRLENASDIPIWTVRLFDVRGDEVGSMVISAADGSFVTPLQGTLVSLPADTTASVTEPGRAQSNDSGDRSAGDRWVDGGGLVGHVSRWGERTIEQSGKTASKVGGSVEAFFIGRPTEPETPGQ